MLGQYQFLCEYLETEPQNNIKNMDNDKLENIINDLTRQASDKAYRMYVEDTISNIMKEYGYDSVVSYNIGEDNKNSRIVFSNDNINICSSVSKDAVMIQSCWNRRRTANKRRGSEAGRTAGSIMFVISTN